MVQIRYFVKAHKGTSIHGPKPVGPKITNSRTISDRAVHGPSGTWIPCIFLNNGNLSVGDNQTALGTKANKLMLFSAGDSYHKN